MFYMYFSASPSSTARGLYLVLDSPTPLRWRLNFSGARSSTKRVIFLPPGSRIHSNYPATEHTLSDLDISTNDDEAFATKTRDKLTALSSFVRILDANRIILHTGYSPNPRCTLSRSPSDFIGSYVIAKETPRGCYNRDMVGLLDTDVHVINLVSAGDGDESATGVLNSVKINLSAEKSRGRLPLDRNLTLVLRSSVPVRWNLYSAGVEGKLIVISDEGSLVHNVSLSPGQTLEVKHKRLPSTMAQIWKTVMLDTGVTPISYAEMDRANVLSMIVPSKSKKGTAPNSHFFNNLFCYLNLLKNSNYFTALYSALSRRKNTESGVYDLAQKTVLIPGNIVETAMNQEANRKNTHF